MPNHVVKEGDCFSSIAAQYGFGSWKLVYDDPGNEALRQKRPNPNLLVPGDVVVVPDKKVKAVDAETGKEHPFKVKLPKAKLRVFLRDVVGEKIASAKCSLEIGGKTISATTDGDGLLEVDIPPDAASATLTVALPPPPAPAKPPADGLKVPKETFKMPVEPKRAIDDLKPPTKLVWTLTLGALRPVADTVGTQNRLHDLGYLHAASGTVDKPTTEAVHAFQFDRKLTVGALDDPTRAELENAHDKGK